MEKSCQVIEILFWIGIGSFLLPIWVVESYYTLW